MRYLGFDWCLIMMKDIRLFAWEDVHARIAHGDQHLGVLVKSDSLEIVVGRMGVWREVE